MAVLYPSQEWCEAWKNALAKDEGVQAQAGAWGVGWNGSWCFEVTPGDGLEQTAFIYIEPTDGGSRASDCRMVASPAEVEAGFHCVGTYGDFKGVVKGEKDFIEGVVKGIFKVTGDMAKIMRNAKWIRAVANSISSFEATYLGE
jgi:hypothetical protein